ncbi:hypothetical protein [Sphingobacterium paludis]|nr:hypothetical protein [Sphingobacterium paludis]
MRYFLVSCASIIMLFSCSSERLNSNSDSAFSGSKVKVFSSCREIETIVTEILYKNRLMDDDNSQVTGNPYFFKCNWKQENTYSPNDVFILRTTSVNYFDDVLMNATPEEILGRVNSRKVTDSRLSNRIYDNILITKGFDQILKANTYILYVWKDGGRIDQVVIRDTNWAENVPDLLEDSSVTNIFLAMLESSS